MTQFCAQALWASFVPLAAEAPGKKPGINPMYQSLFLIFLMFVVLYFVMIRPQQKRQRRRAEMLDALKKGDHVVTTGGIKGVITLVRDREVVVKVDGDVKLTFTKSGIAYRASPGEEGGERTDS